MLHLMPPRAAGTEESNPLDGTPRMTISTAQREGLGKAGVMLVLVALIAGAAFLTWRSFGSAEPAASEAAARPLVTVTVPGTTTIERTVNVTGTIAARNDMPIGVDGETGRIAAVLVEAGDRVRQGQVLARLDTATLAPEVARLEAALEQARAEASLAAAEYGRAAAVSVTGALSQEEIERRRASAVTAEARVKVADAQLAEARARLARSDIRAPVAGIVLERTAEVGQIAGPGGGVLFRLAAGGQIELRGQIAEQDLPRISTGQPATVSLTGIADSFPGSVRLIGAVIDPQTRLGEVRIGLAPDARVRPGAFARGAIAVGSEDRPVVPQTAVLSDPKGIHVIVIDAQDRAERRDVRVSGTTTNGVIVDSGLRGDERVVATAGAFLRPGETVSIAKPAATGSTAGN